MQAKLAFGGTGFAAPAGKQDPMAVLSPNKNQQAVNSVHKSDDNNPMNESLSQNASKKRTIAQMTTSQSSNHANTPAQQQQNGGATPQE